MRIYENEKEYLQDGGIRRNECTRGSCRFRCTDHSNPADPIIGLLSYPSELAKHPRTETEPQASTAIEAGGKIL